MEGSLEQPVVSGFLMVELGNFKDMMKTVCGVHKVLCSTAEITCKEQQDFYLGHDGGFMIPIHSKFERE